MAEKLSAAVVIFFRVVEGLILLRMILSWVPIKKESALVQFLQTVTEPILSPVRNLIARSAFGKDLMIDLSPIMAYLLLGLVEYIILLLIAQFLR